LDKLVYIMAQNPELAVYVKSHTDSEVKTIIIWIFPIEERNLLSIISFLKFNPLKISGKVLENELK
jgi:hypothetical protein